MQDALPFEVINQYCTCALTAREKSLLIAFRRDVKIYCSCPAVGHAWETLDGKNKMKHFCAWIYESLDSYDEYGNRNFSDSIFLPRETLKSLAFNPLLFFFFLCFDYQECFTKLCVSLHIFSTLKNVVYVRALPLRLPLSLLSKLCERPFLACGLQVSWTSVFLCLEIIKYYYYF